MKKAFFVLIAFLITFSSVNAIDWTFPESVPEKVSWSVYADLSDQSFDKIQLFLDGEKVYEKALDEEVDYSKISTVNYYPPEKELSVTLLGLGEGEHSLKLKVLESGSVRDSVNGSIQVFVPSSLAIANEIEGSIQKMKKSIEEFKTSVNEKVSGVNSLKESISAVESDLSSLEKKLSEKENSINSLKSSLETLNKDLASLSQGLSEVSETLQEEDKNTAASLKGLNESIEGIEAQLTELTKPKPAFAGLVSFVQGNPIIAIVLIGIIILLIVISLLKNRSGKETLFETGGFDEALTQSKSASEKESEEPKEKEETSTEKKAGGKWAFGEGEEKDKGKEKKRFHISDLLWKRKEK